MHKLYFDPDDGFIVWMVHTAARLGIARGGSIKFLELAKVAAASALTRRDLDTRARARSAIRVGVSVRNGGGDQAGVVAPSTFSAMSSMNTQDAAGTPAAFTQASKNSLAGLRWRTS